MTPEDVNMKFYYGKRQYGSYCLMLKKNITLINYLLSNLNIFFLEMLAASGRWISKKEISCNN